MMINTSKEDQNNSPSKKEGKSNDNNKIITKASSSTTTTSTPWLRLRDPRIVRVSRAFGGKDRHSKVCTIRGLRDRRVRLSVPTAIQLYDLQDRLGLNQPSKVVDWLLNAAKHEIDELPPLPMLPMNLSLHHQALFSSNTQANKEGFGANISNWEDQSGLSRPNFWNNEAFLRANKSKEVAKSNEDDKEESSEEGNGNNSHQVIPSNSTNLFPRVAHSSSSATTGLINNSMPYGSFFQLEHPNFPFGSHGFTNQGDELHNLNAIPLPSTLSLSSGAASQVLVAPQAYFPNAASTEIDPRQLNHFQMLASSSTQNFFPNSLAPTPYSLNQSPRPLHFSLTPRLFHSLNSGNHHQPDNKEQQ